MAPPPRDPDVAAELEVIELARHIDLATVALWRRVDDLLHDQVLTVDQVAGVLDVSPSTVHRRRHRHA